MKNLMTRFIETMLDPTPLRLQLISRLDRKWNFLSYEQKLRAGLIDRPHYGWPLYRAAILARALSYPSISAIEFGVAGGNGLLALEMHAEQVERLTGVKVEVYGFDTGHGLPKPQDYRDVPYLFKEGYFEMDIEALRARLKRSKLLIGDVRQTVPTFDSYNPAPIGFVAIDVDLYSSTVGALEILKHDRRLLLPRIAFYFDDMIGDIDWAYNDFTGELLAIREFNALHETMKIDRLRGMQTVSRLCWPTDQIYVAHIFDHPHYVRTVNDYLTQLPLKGG